MFRALFFSKFMTFDSKGRHIDHFEPIQKLDPLSFIYSKSGESRLSIHIYNLYLICIKKFLPSLHTQKLSFGTALNSFSNLLPLSDIFLPIQQQTHAIQFTRYHGFPV